MEKFKNVLENKMLRTLLMVTIGLILLIIIVIAVMSGKNTGLSDTKLINAAKSYYKEHPNLLPNDEYSNSTVSLSTLTSTGHINVETSCSAYVSVVKINGEYSYTPFTNCDASSKTLVSKLMENISVSSNGLYYYNGSYIFRGENPNNYLSLGNTLWRIIGTDTSNNIKIMYEKSYEYSEWDDRYNIDYDNTYGINEYEKSRLKENLNLYFLQNSEIFTPTVLARLAKHSVCIGKVNLNNSTIDVCSNVLDNQMVSIINLSDYMNASLDELCSTSNTKNCQNYNFLNDNIWTITASNEDTVNAYYISKYEGVKSSNAYIRRKIKPVIALKNDVIYVSGNGTEENPYKIK